MIDHIQGAGSMLKCRSIGGEKETQHVYFFCLRHHITCRQTRRQLLPSSPSPCSEQPRVLLLALILEANNLPPSIDSFTPPVCIWWNRSRVFFFFSFHLFLSRLLYHLRPSQSYASPLHLRDLLHCTSIISVLSSPVLIPAP